MLASSFSTSFNGIKATIINVQTSVLPGLPSITIVGLPENSIRESKERIKAAFSAIGVNFPQKKVIINLSPADIVKEGSHFDLPIAISILIAINVIKQEDVESCGFFGEISLNGDLVKTNGALPCAISLAKSDFKKLFVPLDVAQEASFAKNIDVFGAKNLKDIISHLKNENKIQPTETLQVVSKNTHDVDFAEIKGQELVKRAAKIAAAGGHNLLLSGPPGSGKSMLAKRMNSIMPHLNYDEAIETSMLLSICGKLDKNGISTDKPFRSPHHSASAVALCGGGTKALPGEVSLAHNGVLFLDELPEFSRQVLETLRQPLEDGYITVSRANNHITYPANFQLIAAMNPCPCGYNTHPFVECRCSGASIDKYMSKISGPLLDRIDIFVNVPAVKYQDLSLPPAKETSKDIKAQVAKAQKIQKARQNGVLNANLDVKTLDKVTELSPDSRNILNLAAEKFNLSARAYHKLIKIARTIADLEDFENIQADHLIEAINFRNFRDAK